MRFYIILTYNSNTIFFYHLLNISYVDYPSEIPRVSKQPIAYVFSTWEQLIKTKNVCSLEDTLQPLKFNICLCWSPSWLCLVGD